MRLSRSRLSLSAVLLALAWLAARSARRSRSWGTPEPVSPWDIARFDRVWVAPDGTRHILDGSAGHTLPYGFHTGLREGCILCRRGGHRHYCHEEDCGVVMRFPEPEKVPPTPEYEVTWETTDDPPPPPTVRMTLTGFRDDGWAARESDWLPSTLRDFDSWDRIERKAGG